MGMPGGSPAGPSPFLAGIGKGRFLGSKAAMLQRFDGSTWRDVQRYRTTHDANIALDHSVGEGEEPDALRIVDISPSVGARVAMIVGAIVCVAVAAGIVWLFVAGS
jgi:hypothetical protein